jgi:hypothetical protein
MLELARSVVRIQMTTKKGCLQLPAGERDSLGMQYAHTTEARQLSRELLGI